MALLKAYMIFAVPAFVCGASNPGLCENAACEGDNTILFQSSISQKPAAHKAALSEEAADVWSRGSGTDCSNGYCFNGDTKCAHEVTEGWSDEERSECFSSYGMTCKKHTHTRVGNDCVRCQGDWTAWSPCSTTCGPGTQDRSWVIKSPPNSENDCTPRVSTETRACPNPPHCPVHCEYSYSAVDDGETPPCTASCGGGLKYSCLNVVTQAQHGGTECPEDLKAEPCNEQACPVDCVVSWDQEWSKCTQECGAGKQFLKYTIVTHPAHEGAACPAIKEEDCNEHPCPVDCTGDWSEWGDCSAQCGPGYRSRKFTVAHAGSSGGKGCPSSPDREACDLGACPPVEAQQEIVHLPKCPSL